MFNRPQFSLSGANTTLTDRKMEQAKEQDHEIFLKTEQLLFFRLAFAGVGFILALGVQCFAHGEIDLSPALSIICVFLFYCGAALLLLKHRLVSLRAHVVALNALLIATDVLSLTALVHVTRGVESDLYVLYLLPILLSSYTFQRFGINATALLVSVSYVGLLLIENRTLLPCLIDPHPGVDLVAIYARQLWLRILAKSALLVSVSFIWGRFCEYMSGVAQQGANRLREQLSENTQLVAEVRAQAAREQLINSINSALRSTLDLNQIFETAVDELGRALEADGCAIVCPSPHPDEPPLVCESVFPPLASTATRSLSPIESGTNPLVRQTDRERSDTERASKDQRLISFNPGDFTSGGRIRSLRKDSPIDLAALEATLSSDTSIFSTALCKLVLAEKCKYEKSPLDGNIVRVFIFDDPAGHSLFAPVKEELQRAELSSLIIKPMMYADESKGVLLIAARRRERVWTVSELELVKSTAGQVAVAIEHAGLVEQLSRKNKDLLQQNLKLDAKNLELRAVQSQLVHQEKMASLGRLVAGIAHELNNPINFVHGNLPYLREYFQDLKKLIAAADALPLDQRGEIDKLKQALKYDFLITDLDNIIADLNEGAERIRHIIRNLRSFSRLDEAELKEASIQEGIESTLKILSQYYGRDKIPVECSFAPLPPVLCYPGQLNQVWMNLLSNAAEALGSSADGKVKIETTMDHDCVSISITDNGPGIKPEVQSKIFEPFFTTKPVGQGTGLGLSICHSIIERHGGQILCHSSTTGGTTFQVTIPINAQLNAQPGSEKILDTTQDSA